MNINVQIIPHHNQRYNTVGDWWFRDYVGAYGPTQSLEIRVSAMSDWRYEMAVALHEQYEALLCYSGGVTAKRVTEFDMAFELNPDTTKYVDEPGDDASAPYYGEHAKALVIEYMFLADTDVVRHLYLAEMDTLYRPDKKWQA